MSISRCFPSTQCFTLESSHVYIKPLKIIHYYSLDCSDTLWVWILDVVVKLCIFANGIPVQMNCILITYLNQQSRTTTVNWFAKRFSISNSEPISYYYYFEIFYDNFKSWTWKPCDEMKKKSLLKCAWGTGAESTDVVMSRTEASHECSSCITLYTMCKHRVI